MKIAVGSDDRETIRKGHFGESLHFIVYEILNGELVGKEVRDNESLKEGPHHGKSGDVMRLLPDCQIFMARSMGAKSMRNITREGVECILTEIECADEAIARFLDGEDEPYKYYDDDRDALIACRQRRKKA